MGEWGSRHGSDSSLVARSVARFIHGRQSYHNATLLQVTYGYGAGAKARITGAISAEKV
jgi:hypothetical protein